MIDAPLFWTSSFIVFFLSFVCILVRERDYRFILYFIFGALAGFFFDIIQVNMGYYSYTEQAYMKLFFNGVPVTMTLAEGFCISITVYLYEKLPRFFSFLKTKK